jgi:hypothetical protein
MQRIANTELAVQVIGRWNPADIAFVRSLQYEVTDDPPASALEIEFIAIRREMAPNGWPFAGAPYYRVRMRFQGIRNLQLKGFGEYPPQMVGFEITDISDRGWERIQFQVEDYENDRLSFWCEDAAIVAVEPVPFWPDDARPGRETVWQGQYQP